MIKKFVKEDYDREYLYYLMNDIGLLNDYELNEANVSFDEFDNIDNNTLEKLENYRDKKNRS